MAKYRIIPSSRTIVQSPISIGHKAEKGVEAIEFDLTAWVETYGSGTLTVIMRRWGDAIPYPIALEIDENNKATWVLSDTDTARAGMAYAQLSYIVGETVVKKSDIYAFRVMDSLTGEGDPPEAYESWLENLTHLAAEAMAEVLDIEGVATDKTLTVDGGIADAKATGDALALKADKSTTYTKTEVDQMIEDVEVETDTTLEVAGAAADAAETGRQIGLIKADLGDLEPGLSNEAKTALLNCFRHVAFLDDDADYYSALENALYPDQYPKITAVFDPGANVIYTDDSLDTLKQYLTVKYYETSSSSGTVISSSNYSISGSLSEGNNRLVVTYGTYITSFNVTAVDFYNIFTWTMGENLTKLNGGIDPQVDYSPSRLSISATSAANYQRRRTMVTNHGKRQIYRPSTTTPETSSWAEIGYYPIPVPLSANHIKITMSPLQDVYAHFVPYIESSNNYGDTTNNNKITWTTIPSAGLEKNIVQSDAGQLFMIANFRYNSSASDYPIEPSEIKIEFSEV